MLIEGKNLKLSGTIIDHKLYHYETDNEDEAFYLSAILNSTLIDETIKDAQSKGGFGPRDIHKKPFEISISKFTSQNGVHRELSRLGKICTSEVEKILPDLEEEYDSIGWIRKKINEKLKPYLDEIDDLVLKLFEVDENEGTLTAFTT